MHNARRHDDMRAVVRRSLASAARRLVASETIQMISPIIAVLLISIGITYSPHGVTWGEHAALSYILTAGAMTVLAAVAVVGALMESPALRLSPRGPVFDAPSCYAGFAIYGWVTVCVHQAGVSISYWFGVAALVIAIAGVRVGLELLSRRLGARAAGAGERDAGRLS
jgi:hypothetical protein